MSKVMFENGIGHESSTGLEVPSAPRIWTYALAGFIAITVFVAGFVGWSMSAPLSTAAVTTGVIKVERNRRVVQNLEGGVIREIFVQEGSMVTPGQVVMRLHDEQTGASADLLSNFYDSQRVLRARLRAETERAEELDIPEDVLGRRSQARISDLVTQQISIFRERRRSIEGQTAILKRRAQQLEAEIRAYEAISQSHQIQLQFIREEEKTVRTLVNQGYEKKPRLLALQRQAAALEGNRDEQNSLIARARQSIAENELQITQLQTNFQREVALELRDVENRIVETEERQRAASDIQLRREIVAPVGGMVVNFRFNTIGGVVRPGEQILEIVPGKEKLIIEVTVMPQDIDIVSIGLRAEVRLTAFKQRVVPMIHGHVIYVSADAFANERTGQLTYRAHVQIDEEQVEKLEKLVGVRLSPGMPAEVLIASGERTFLSYLVTPLRDSFRRAFREQ